MRPLPPRFPPEPATDPLPELPASAAPRPSRSPAAAPVSRDPPPVRDVPTVPLPASPFRPPAADRAGRPPGRVEWVDAAKGMTILLVVLHHLTLFLQPHGFVPGPVATINMGLTSLRMPLFFLASGLFFAGPLAGSWRVLLHKRVALFGYLYVLWATLQFLEMSLLPPGVAAPEVTQDAAEYVTLLLVPAPAMWFLYALSVYSVLAKLARPVPPWLQLTVTGAVSATIGADLVVIPSETWSLTIRYLFFFLLGCYARGLVERVAELTGVRRIAVGGAAVLVGALSAVALISGLRWVPGLALLLNLAVVVCGVQLAAWIAPSPISRPLLHLGRNTLQVYLTNVLWIGLITLLLRQVPIPPPHYPLPLILMVVVTALALLTGRALRAGWLYELPRPLAYRQTARPEPSEPPGGSRSASPRRFAE